MGLILARHPRPAGGEGRLQRTFEEISLLVIHRRPGAGWENLITVLKNCLLKCSGVSGITQERGTRGS